MTGRRSAAPTAETYSAFLNEKLNDICESTEGAPSPKFMSSTSISEFVQFCPASFDEVQKLISSPPINVALFPYQPGFSRDFPIYYFLISFIYLINRYLQVNFLVPSRRHRFDPYLKKLHLTHNYLHHTDQFPISACFQSFRSALSSAVSSPISTAMHYSPRLSQHIVRTTPRKLLS